VQGARTRSLRVKMKLRLVLTTDIRLTRAHLSRPPPLGTIRSETTAHESTSPSTVKCVQQQQQGESSTKTCKT
jgi:hypothetical protein